MIALVLAGALNATEPEAATAVTTEVELENQRLYRVGATLLGGAAGIAAPMLIGWGIDRAQNCRPVGFATCSDAGVGVGTGFLPLTLTLGTWGPHSLLHGQAGPGFGLGGGFAGYFVGLLLLGAMSLVTWQFWGENQLVAGAAFLSAMTLGGSVLGLEARHSALSDGARPWKAGRMIGSSAAMFLPMALVEVGVVFLGVSQWQASTVIVLVGTVVNALGGVAAGWGVHRALGGRGSFFAALGGLLGGGALAAGFGLLHFPAGLFSPRTGGGTTTAAFPFIGIAALVAAAGPAVALEWQSANEAPAHDEDREKEPEEVWTVQLAPAPGGVSLGVAGRF